MMEAKDIDKKMLDNALKDLCSVFLTVRFLGYSKEQAKEFILKCLDIAYKDKEEA